MANPITNTRLSASQSQHTSSIRTQPASPNMFAAEWAKKSQQDIDARLDVSAIATSPSTWQSETAVEPVHTHRCLHLARSRVSLRSMLICRKMYALLNQPCPSIFMFHGLRHLSIRVPACPSRSWPDFHVYR